MLTFTCVFYENTYAEAEKRLETLRKTDNSPEIKAYIIQSGDQFRVLRKTEVLLHQNPLRAKNKKALSKK